MRAAADVIDDAVFRQNLVMNFAKSREMGQDVSDKPEERIQLADATDRELQISRSPLTLDLRACGNQAVANPRKPLRRANRLRPEIAQERSDAPFGE